MNRKEFIERWKWQKATGGGSASFDFGEQLEKDLKELFKASRLQTVVGTDALAEIDKIISDETILNKAFDTDDWWTCDKLRIPFENHTTRMLKKVRDKLSK